MGKSKFRFSTQLFLIALVVLMSCFLGCVPKPDPNEGGSAITAASTESYIPYGFVFNRCTVTGTGTAITDLGRPWRLYASVTFMNSSLRDVIKQGVIPLLVPVLLAQHQHPQLTPSLRHEVRTNNIE